MRKKVLIMGAAGRDFHNFNTYFRNNPFYEVVCFTATQIPDIEDRTYPKELCGDLYPLGIPIYSENKLVELIKKYDVDSVVFAYSDVPHEYVMHKASIVLACGADFRLLGPKDTMIKSSKPLIATGAVRTGCGKSQTTRRIADVLLSLNKKIVVIRHPMPYDADLNNQIVQRFENYDDLKVCTIEEMEEYEPLIDRNIIVYAGVDYGKILEQAEKEADVIIWDGGNNDFPFYKPDLMVTIVDPLRAGHEVLYHPGETCLRMADIIVINKIDSADKASIDKVKANIKETNPGATIIEAESPVTMDNPSLIKNKTVLIVEDGPTLTHGGMAYGAGFVAAKRFGAKKIVDPRPYAIGSILETYKKYTTTGAVLPAMGYSAKQIDELKTVINNTPCDIVVIATPIDLLRFIDINKPGIRVKYELKETTKPDLEELLKKHFSKP
ncbi:MAG: cyclic 2,3-diphosphoglycerate synthase [bacterium]|nr:cyclic 2,3-diphosphoglycerate synthase [bacterium]